MSKRPTLTKTPTDVQATLNALLDHFGSFIPKPTTKDTAVIPPLQQSCVLRLVQHQYNQ